jgi:hypothetical protein
MGGPEKARALAAVTTAHPGTVASGLAQLAAGYALLDGTDSGRRRLASGAASATADVVNHLSHPDIRKTGLLAYATLALGQALRRRAR